MKNGGNQSKRKKHHCREYLSPYLDYRKSFEFIKGGDKTAREM